jgi:IS1 family transposase
MKAAGTAGSIWTWTCLDADSRLIISYLVGDRDQACANEFMLDVASRIVGKFQLTSDAFAGYLNAVQNSFEAVDYAQLIKIYRDTPERGPDRKYSPSECIGTRKRRVLGDPDMAHVSTSLVEKHNQTMRQHMKRFARLTAAHSKKVANHAHMVALYTLWYNYARINSAVRVSPAMAANLTTTLWDVADIVRLIDSHEAGEF